MAVANITSRTKLNKSKNENMEWLAAIFPPQTTPRAVISRTRVTPIPNMAACARKRGFSVATVAKAKAVTRFSVRVRVRVVYNLLKCVFRRYSHSTHTGTERIAHQSFLKYLGGISRSVDSSHFVCEAFCYANVRKRAPS